MLFLLETSFVLLGKYWLIYKENSTVMHPTWSAGVNIDLLRLIYNMYHIYPSNGKYIQSCQPFIPKPNY